MDWKPTPKVKVYEAIGCVADGRVEVDGNTAKVFSSSRGKYYSVQYDPATNAIMVNDNASYWKGYLGYPGVAFLLKIGKLPYDSAAGQAIKDIAWKEINTKHKNDFEEALLEIREIIIARGDDWSAVEQSASAIYDQLQGQTFPMLGPKVKPPAGY